MKKNAEPTSYSLTVEFSDGVVASSECESNEKALALVDYYRVTAGYDRINHGTTYTVMDYRIVPIYAV